MRAVLVSVDYHDYLALTLPHNRHHFDQVLVVTDDGHGRDAEVARRNNCLVYATDAFYRRGADFNKWLALEEGLDWFGRHGFMVLMDADVLWPKDLKGWAPEAGFLYSPLRHMMRVVTLPFPPENEWVRYSIHPNVSEWAGYSQIFHAYDPALGSPPWHEVNWRHAGGADSFFQQKWPAEKKVRPDWNCLHLGTSGTNWCGRATDYLDGTRSENPAQKMNKLRQYVRQRRQGGRLTFDHEKLK